MPALRHSSQHSQRSGNTPPPLSVWGALWLLFHSSPQNGNGKLNFRHYLYGVLRMSLPFTTDDSLRSMFEVSSRSLSVCAIWSHCSDHQFFDGDGRGVVTMGDVTSRLPIQWREPSNVRGSPPSRHKGCDMCGCGRVRRRAQGPAPQLISLPPEMTYGRQCCMCSPSSDPSPSCPDPSPPTEQFCHAMLSNREYLLLYHECQTAAISAPSAPSLPPSSPPPSYPHHVEVAIEN